MLPISRQILYICCLFLVATAFPTDLEGFMDSGKNLNPPFATSFMNCNDVDFGTGSLREILKIKKVLIDFLIYFLQVYYIVVK